MRKGQAAVDGLAQVGLTFDHVLPGWGIRILKIRHKNTGPGIERVDQHLAVRGASDFDTAFLKICRGGCNFPIQVAAHVRCVREKSGQNPGVDLYLPVGAALEQFGAAAVELPLQSDDELQRRRGEDFFGLRRLRGC